MKSVELMMYSGFSYKRFSSARKCERSYVGEFMALTIGFVYFWQTI